MVQAQQIVSQIPSLTRQMAGNQVRIFFPLKNFQKLQSTVTLCFGYELIPPVKQQLQPFRGRHERVLSGAIYEVGQDGPQHRLECTRGI